MNCARKEARLAELNRNLQALINQGPGPSTIDYERTLREINEEIARVQRIPCTDTGPNYQDSPLDLVLGMVIAAVILMVALRVLIPGIYDLLYAILYGLVNGLAWTLALITAIVVSPCGFRYALEQWHTLYMIMVPVGLVGLFILGVIVKIAITIHK